MKKLDKIVVILSMVSMVLCVIAFLYLLITDENFKNGGQMAICLGFFWFFFFIGKAVADSSKDYNENPVPEEGRRIRITWLKHCRNVPAYVPNPYIGMSGIAKNVQKDGSFDLDCGTSWLLVGREYKFEYLD